MTEDHPFMLSKEERERLDGLAKREPDNIRQMDDGLKGEAREKYLIALRQQKR